MYRFLALVVLSLSAPAFAGTSDAPAPAAKSAAPQGTTAAVADVLPALQAGKQWKMIWHDEFEGKTLDTSKWTFRPDGKCKDGWWSSKAVSLDGKGHVSLSATRQGDKCVSGDIITETKFEHAFGYYVCRVMFTKQPGHWSAFWLTNKTVLNVGEQGRDGTEIDIYEKPHIGDQIEHNLHWNGYEKDTKCANHKETVPGLSEGWHTAGLWWTPQEYVFYIDGKETWRTSAGGVSQAPQYILLSDEVGKWAGDISKAKLPDTFLVDYVRVYEPVDAK